MAPRPAPGRDRSEASRGIGVSFDVRPGEVFGFLGPNGAGKTTTIELNLGVIAVVLVASFALALGTFRPRED